MQNVRQHVPVTVMRNVSLSRKRSLAFSVLKKWFLANSSSSISVSCKCSLYQLVDMMRLSLIGFIFALSASLPELSGATLLLDPIAVIFAERALSSAQLTPAT